MPVAPTAGSVGPNPTDASLTVTDVTSNNVTSTAHGLTPKSPADAYKFLDGAATPTWAYPPIYGAGLRRSGALLESFPRSMSSTDQTNVIASGTLYLYALSIDLPTVITNISFISGNTASGSQVNWWFALYDSTRALLSQTADQTSTAWAANTEKTLALGAAQTIAGGSMVYVGIMMKFGLGNPPSLYVQTAGRTNLPGFAPILCGSADASLSTTAPNPATALTATQYTPYFYVS